MPTSPRLKIEKSPSALFVYNLAAMPTLEPSRDIAVLLAIMKTLRESGGCPWDRGQTFDTIAPYTIEEAYEVASAIEDKDFRSLPGELGDLLFQVVFHARMAEEAGHFDFADVARAIADKMEARHPHIFGDATTSPGWEALKAAERDLSGTQSALDGVATALPALLRAEKLQRRAARTSYQAPARVKP